MRVVVHGGAGSRPAEPTARQAVLDEAARAGSETERPTAAVRAAVRHLESDPRFNAGVGGSVQSDGIVRTDAGVMTSDGEVGAACSMPGVERALDVARVVKEETPHVLVAGVHAVDLAAAFGVETGVDLGTQRTHSRWEAVEDPPSGDAREHAAWVRERFGGDPEGRDADGRDADGRDADGSLANRDHDTVGAVATDGEHVAAATSTGGRWLALAGRVGDVPQVGAGFYSSPAGGASATGAGEDIATAGLSRRAVGLLESGYNAQDAAETAIEEFGESADGSAGLVVLAPDGDVGASYDSEAMQTSSAGRP